MTDETGPGRVQARVDAAKAKADQADLTGDEVQAMLDEQRQLAEGLHQQIRKGVDE